MATPAPESGRALELGGKWQAPDGRLGATVALFDIVKDNVLTGDPANPGNLIAAGRVRSRGLEADFSGQLGEHWRLNGSLSWIDVEVLRDNTLYVGGSLINVPELNGSLLGVHERELSGDGLWASAAASPTPAFAWARRIRRRRPTPASLPSSCRPIR